MSFLHRCITSRRALFSCAVLGLGAGCAPQSYSQPPPDAPVVIQSAPVSEPQPQVVAGPGEDDGDVIYEPEAPVDDIESYPSVDYQGVPTYYVGGRWYHHGPHGWAYYRQEPADLGRERRAHEHDEHWARARDAPIRRQEHVAPAVVPRPQEHVAPAVAPRPLDRHVPEHVAPVVQPHPPEHVAPVAPQRPPEHVVPPPKPVAPPHVQSPPPPQAPPPPPPKRNPTKEPDHVEPRR